MLVDRRKDNYDELMLLSRDSRERRKRVNRWTTALVAGGMAVSAAYVASTAKQVDALQDEAKQIEQLRRENALLIADRDRLQAERDTLVNYKNWIASAAPEMELSDSMNRLVTVLSGEEPTTPVTPAPSTQVIGLSEVVWLVDGSRRFPMAEKDYLWIPEASVWVQLESITNKTITIFSGDRNTGGTPQSLERAFFPLPVEGRGNANNACLKLHQNSNRPGFQSERFADLEILFVANDCPEELPSPPAEVDP